jgi:riboflavin kinase/FMN adenylyltransferase
MMNIGMRPTLDLDEPTRQIEIHLFDFAGDLYGQSLQVEVMQFLRHEIRFEDIHALANQLKQDENQIRALLNGISRQPHTL